jgi:hypothetical protein
MELVLDLNAPGAGNNEGDGEDASHGGAGGGTPWIVRLVLALAAIAAAYFIMTDPAPAKIASRIVGHNLIGGGGIPGPIGTLVAGLPCPI